MLKDSKAQIETQSQVLVNLQKQFQQKELDIEELRYEFEDFGEMSKIEVDKLRSMIKELKKNKQILLNETKALRIDCDQMYQKKQLVNEELHKIKIAMEILKQDENKYNEDLFKMNVRISQLEIELENLDTQIDSQRKSGRQPIQNKHSFLVKHKEPSPYIKKK